MVNSTSQKRPRYRFTTYVQHSSAINTSLRQEGRPDNCRRFVWVWWKLCVFVEVVQYGASHALSPCLLHNPINAVYIKRSHFVHLYLSYIVYLGSLHKLPAYCTSSPLPQAPFAWQVYRSSVTSRPPQTDAKNSPSCLVNHRCPISILAMSTACTTPNHAKYGPH